MNKIPRIMNDPDNIVDEMLEGFLKAHADLVEKTENKRVVKAKNIPSGKVGVVTGGGSGHKPAFIGYVGESLCDILNHRLKIASLMLKNEPYLQVAEISDRLGFGSPRYFSRCFKNQYNVTPMEYRKGAKQENLK